MTVKGEIRGPYRTGAKMVLHHDPLHRSLWRRADNGHRLVVQVAALAAKYDVNYDTAQKVLSALEVEGRIAFVGYAGKGGVRRFQIADPDRWERWDTTTHATKQAVPQWG